MVLITASFTIRPNSTLRDQGLWKLFICSNDTHNSLPTRYKRPKDNLTPSERTALKELKALSDRVIIKPADKGSAVVIMDREDYLKEGMRQLSDLNFYGPVQEDLSAEHMLSIRDIVSNMYARRKLVKKLKTSCWTFPCVLADFICYPKSIRESSLHREGQSSLAMVAQQREFPSLWISLWRNYPQRDHLS